ncbi:MAG: hypothetical protein PHP33_04755 [Bacteroidales bacterium]|nr:hypothetical protein [Bacteroidales bacterium]
MKRRDFFKVAAAAGVSYAASPVIRAADNSLIASVNQEIETNIADASKSPRVAGSMPGRFPGRVVKCINGKSVSAEGEHNPEVIYDMLAKSMLALTGKDNLPDAWRMFVSPEDIIGLKVNPVAGRLLTTSHAVTKSDQNNQSSHTQKCWAHNNFVSKEPLFWLCDKYRSFTSIVA